MLRSILICFFLFAGFTGYSQKVIVNPSPTTNDRFSKKAGSLRLSKVTCKLGNIRSNDVVSDTIHIFNDGERPLTIRIGVVPEHIKITLDTSILAPGSDSWLHIKYDASKKSDFGFMVDRIELITNDPVHAKKAINLTANIVEYFPVLSPEDSVNVQKARWLETSFNYGSIKQGEKVSHKFEVANEGKKNLIIRKTKSSCTCLKSVAVTDTIAPGVTGNVTVEFDSGNKSGKESRRMTVFLNDPAKPEVMLEMTGEVMKNDSIK